MHNENSNVKLAVITGASSGIGAEFARQLAGSHKSMWLIGRREEKLQSLAQELSNDHGVSARCMVLDLSAVENINSLADEMGQEESLDMLVNNAGYAEDGEYHELEWKKHQDITNVHIYASMKLAHVALGVMVQNGSGSIINVASVASFIPTPSSPLYGPTKAFLRSFSESLASIYGDKGIQVQALCPGYTVTDFHEKIGLDPDEFYKDSGLMRSWSSEYVVRESLRDLKRKKAVSIPGWNYKLVVALLRRLPLGWIGPMVSSGNKSHRYNK